MPSVLVPLPVRYVAASAMQSMRDATMLMKTDN